MFSTTWKSYSKERKKLFWLFQFLFWFIHWLVNLIIYPVFTQKIYELLDLTLTVSLGFYISLLLRLIYIKYNFHKQPLLKLTITTLTISIVAGFIFVYGGLFISYVLSGFKHFSQVKNLSELVRYLWLNSYPFVVWSALYFGYKIWEEWNVQSLMAEKERYLAQSAQIEMLRYQLNPHFLFNTLSSLRALIRFDVNRAEEMITRISEFLRYSLSYENENEVPLNKEIEIIKNYLDIEKVRFGNKLYVEFSIDDLAEDYPIPIFLIHPLIENAIKHGMRTSVMPLKINIIASVIENNLLIEVNNSGKWIEESSPIKGDGTGKGLENVRKRLEFSYPGNYQFEILKHSDSVQIKIALKKELVKRNGK